jgi:hypothetical protein
VLVQNRMAAALLGDKSGYTGLARSEIYRWFTDPGERRLYPEHDRDRQSRAMVANLRSAYGSMGSVTGRRDRPQPAEGQPGVRGTVGTA